jgi:hypothetical protein
MIATVLLIAALICAILAALEASVPRINLIGAALAFYFASLLVGMI